MCTLYVVNCVAHGHTGLSSLWHYLLSDLDETSFQGIVFLPSRSRSNTPILQVGAFMVLSFFQDHHVVNWVKSKKTSCCTFLTSIRNTFKGIQISNGLHCCGRKSVVWNDLFWIIKVILIVNVLVIFILSVRPCPQ